MPQGWSAKELWIPYENENLKLKEKKKEIRERNSVYRRVKVITEICKRLSCSQEISYSLLTVLRTKNLGAQRVDRGQAFHLSTILLKKADFENCLSPLWEYFTESEYNRIKWEMSILVYSFMTLWKN